LDRERFVGNRLQKKRFPASANAFVNHLEFATSSKETRANELHAKKSQQQKAMHGKRQRTFNS
jgi:hypothetical protein